MFDDDKRNIKKYITDVIFFTLYIDERIRSQVIIDDDLYRFLIDSVLRIGLESSRRIKKWEKRWIKVWMEIMSW